MLSHLKFSLQGSKAFRNNVSKIVKFALVEHEVRGGGDGEDQVM